MFVTVTRHARRSARAGRVHAQDLREDGVRRADERDPDHDGRRDVRGARSVPRRRSCRKAASCVRSRCRSRVPRQPLRPLYEGRERAKPARQAWRGMRPSGREPASSAETRRRRDASLTVRHRCEAAAEQCVDSALIATARCCRTSRASARVAASARSAAAGTRPNARACRHRSDCRARRCARCATSLRHMHPDDANRRRRRRCRAMRDRRAARSRTSRESGATTATLTPSSRFSRAVSMRRAILGIAQMLEEKRAVAIVRIAGQRAHRGRAVAAVQRVLVEQAERLAGRLHERREKLPRERRLAGAGVTAEKNQMRHA